MQITQEQIASLHTGERILRFRITNSSGAYVELTNWGARWISACVPDRNHQLSNVIIGPSQTEDYLSDNYYMGAIIGRFANRISQAEFSLNGKRYTLEANDGKNCNHGGTSGFHQKAWLSRIKEDGVCFSLFSPDGEGGFPGNLHVEITYRWTEQNELSIEYRGTTDRDTFLNMTNHAYFNLSGKPGKITAHELYIPAKDMLDTTAEFIPTGQLIPVAGTPFDFTQRKPIGQDLYCKNQQIIWNKGYNHCYVIKERKSDEMAMAACLYDPYSKRKLTVFTDLPGMLLYTCGYYIEPDTAVCLETQFFPDTPSHAHFPSCRLEPAQVYKQHTVYRFEND